MPESLANGRFQILETLHADDLQIVRRCRDTKVGREVLVEGPGPALRELVAGGEVSRAVREARALARVQHPGVQRLLDVIEDQGGPLLVLEPVEGETLAARLEREGPLPVEDVLSLARDLADVLAAVHEAGVVHRSLDAHSVLLPASGGVRLRGFRLAKMSSLESTLTATSLPYDEVLDGGRSVRALLPRYPAPEQLGGESAGARTDLFGLGCLLYLAATGEDAYDDLLLSTAPRRPTPLARVVADAPAELARAVDACLAWSPLERPKSAAEVRDALGVRGPGAASQDESPSVPGAARRGPALYAAAAIAVTAALGLMAWWPSDGGDEVLASRGLSVTEGESGSRLAGKKYATGFRKSYALLIGIGDYESEDYARLPNAERDVKAVAARLEELPRDWELFEGGALLGKAATRKAIVGALTRLLEVVGPEDRVFVYFAGHGTRRQGSTGWMVPYDADAEDGSSFVLFDQLDNFMRDAVAKHVLVALDCCYAGRLVERSSALRSAAIFEERYTTEPARVVLCSGLDTAVLDGPRNQNSPFAQAFLDVLDSKERYAVTSSQIFAGIQARFDEEGITFQTPVIARPEASAGEFVFFLRDD